MPAALRKTAPQTRSEAISSFSEARYRDLAAIASEWFWEIDVERRFTFVSSQFAEAVGMARDDIIGRRFTELPRLKPALDATATISAAIAARQAFIKVDFRIDFSDGSLRFWRASGKPFFFADGAFAGYRGCASDITEYFENEVKLTMALSAAEAADQQASKDRARLLDAIEIMPAGFALWDANDRLELCNAQFRRIYGKISDLMVPGVSFEDVLRAGAERGQYPVGDDVETWIAEHIAMRQAVMQRTNARGTITVPFADGRFIEVDERPTADGGFVATRIDVTERRKREASDTEQAKLTALGQLAGGVAHEINNLLQPSLMLPEFIAARLPADDDDSRTDLAMILEGARKARDIVKSILLFARKEELTLTEFALVPELRATLDFVRGLIARSVVVESDLPDTLAGLCVLANKTQLTQVITNLVINAAQAMNDRGMITVAAAEFRPNVVMAAQLGIDAARRYLSIEVRDTGGGMDQATLARIFEPFFTTKPQGQGTGLGLAVVYGILKSWSGTITASSVPGYGATFTFYVPLIEPLARD